MSTSPAGCRDAQRLVRLHSQRGILRLRRPAQRAQPARPAAVELRRGGERQRPDGFRAGRRRPLHVPERAERGVLPAGGVLLLARVRVPARQPRARAVPDGLRPRARLERRGLLALARLRRRPATARRRDRHAHAPERPPAVAAAWALGPMLDRLVKNFGETEQDYESNVAADLINLRRAPRAADRIPDRGLGLPDGTATTGSPCTRSSPPRCSDRSSRRFSSRHIHALVYLRPWITPGSAAGEAGPRGPARRRLAVLHDRHGRPADRPARLHQPGRGPVLAAGGRQGIRPRRRRIHAGLRRGGPVRHALRRRSDRDGRCTTAISSCTPRRPATRSRATSTRTPAGSSGSSTAPATPASPERAAYDGGKLPGRRDERLDADRPAWPRSPPTCSSRAVTGAYGYGTDIGGYYDLTNPPTSKELFLRWAEWAALSPDLPPARHGQGGHSHAVVLRRSDACASTTSSPSCTCERYR